jgi:hypothetical protein
MPKSTNNGPAVSGGQVFSFQRDFEAIELVNCLCRDLDWACAFNPQIAIALEAKLLTQERRIRWKLEQVTALHPDAESRWRVQRLASITTALGMTTHFLSVLRSAFRRAHRRQRPRP